MQKRSPPPVLSVAALHRHHAVGLMVASSIMISLGGLIVRSIEDADAWQINLYRALGLALGTLVVLVLKYRSRTPQAFHAVGRAGAIGAFLAAIAGICYLQAMTNTTVANTLFTISAIPFISAVFGWVILGGKVSGITLVMMMVAALGVGIMVAEGFGAGSAFGNVMALCAACAFSGYTIAVRGKRSVDMMPTNALAGLFILLAAVIMRFDDWLVPVWDMGLAFVWGGVIATLGNIMFVIAARSLMAAELTLLMLLEFALGPIWVWLVVSEEPRLLTLLGGALVFSAVIGKACFELLVERSRKA
ncbi:DMT family transporter [Coralliovum pocilloporae]|uniref:DMT family transporter n=1 Tax=Coralliovum pocilloporae TaxID=3066369 RepID=UPI003307ADAB